MAWMTLAFFLITVPLAEYVIMLGYTYFKNSTAFMGMIAITPFVLIPLIIYLATWWYLVSGLICKDPSNMGTSWIPIVIFGIIALVSTIMLILYIWAFDTAHTMIADARKQASGWVVAATPTPTPTPTPKAGAATTSPAPTVTASATPSTVKTATTG
jgi:protein-S-isoprenylcysteine O-methyltransferase Ste14